MADFDFNNISQPMKDGICEAEGEIWTKYGGRYGNVAFLHAETPEDFLLAAACDLISADVCANRITAEIRQGNVSDWVSLLRADNTTFIQCLEGACTQVDRVVAGARETAREERAITLDQRGVPKMLHELRDQQRLSFREKRLG